MDDPRDFIDSNLAAWLESMRGGFWSTDEHGHWNWACSRDEQRRHLELMGQDWREVSEVEGMIAAAECVRQSASAREFFLQEARRG